MPFQVGGAAAALNHATEARAATKQRGVLPTSARLATFAMLTMLWNGSVFKRASPLLMLRTRCAKRGRQNSSELFEFLARRWIFLRSTIRPMGPRDSREMRPVRRWLHGEERSRSCGAGASDGLEAKPWLAVVYDKMAGHDPPCGPIRVTRCNGKQSLEVEKSMFIGAGQVGPWAKADGVTPFDQVSCDDTNSRSRRPYLENQQAHRLLIIRLSPRCRARQQGGRCMDSRTCWITDDRDLFSPSGCNEAVVPGWIYASDSWRRGVILCTRISPLADACTDTVCTRIPGPLAASSNINSSRRSRALTSPCVL